MSVRAPAPALARAAPGAAAARGPAAVARACDRLLELAIVAFAAWTVIYHLCAVLRLPARWAALAGALALVPCAWAVWRPEPEPAAAAAGAAPAPPAVPRGSRALVGAALATAVAGAALFAAEVGPWTLTIAVWLASAGLAMAATTARAGRAGGPPPATTTATRPWPGAARGWLEPLVVGAWAAGLAVLSLFIRAPDADDSYYVHLSAWIAEHGRFPVRDVLFSDHVFPALYFPPVPSYEALVGTLARYAHVPVADVEYLVVPPVATVLAILALWRLLRGWRVPMPALALSVSVVFLLFAADENRMLGGFFVSRLWQGKVVLLCVLVPVLLALLQAYAERPARRSLALVACATVAAVGLSTTAIFVIPVIATACLAPMAARAPRAALAGWLAAVAYPAAAAVATLALDGRQPEVYKASDLVPSTLVHYALGTGVVGFIAMLALLAGPVLLRSAVAGQMLASAALAVGILYVPHVPLAIFDLTELGRVLWRLTWAMPVAALVGALATSVVPARAPVVLRLAPAAAVAAAMALAGVPLWSPGAGAEVASRPSWKRAPEQVAAARAILARARPGDLVLAPDRVSQTLAVLSGSVTTVSPRLFFVRALADVPAMHATERERLRRLVVRGRRRPAGAEAAAAVRALRVTGVDIACVARRDRAARRVLARAGYADGFRAAHLRCERAPASG